MQIVGRIGAFAAAGFLASLAGFYLSSRLQIASHLTGSDLGFLVAVIGAVLIGGLSLTKRTGWVGSTFVGVLLIAILQRGFLAMNVASNLTLGLIAFVVLIILLVNRLIEWVVSLLMRSTGPTQS